MVWVLSVAPRPKLEAARISGITPILKSAYGPFTIPCTYRKGTRSIQFINYVTLSHIAAAKAQTSASKSRRQLASIDAWQRHRKATDSSLRCFVRGAQHKKSQLVRRCVSSQKTGAGRCIHLRVPDGPLPRRSVRPRHQQAVSLRS
jgi:hypothetical protein